MRWVLWATRSRIQDKIDLLLLRRTLKHIKLHGKRLVNLPKQVFFTNLMFFLGSCLLGIARLAYGTVVGCMAVYSK